MVSCASLRQGMLETYIYTASFKSLSLIH